MKFNFWIQQINLYTKYNNWNLNNLKSRIKNFSKVNNLIGYKMYLSGRFKRKQRAAYYWFSKGKIPLNTIKAYINYAYYTIVLKNSVITVKIWLYKSTNINNIYYIKIF
jgi:ribosomal protein S3